MALVKGLNESSGFGEMEMVINTFVKTYEKILIERNHREKLWEGPEEEENCQLQI